MYFTVGDWMRGTEIVVPGQVLESAVEDFGDRRLRALPMRGHTSSDLVLFDELSGVIIAAISSFWIEPPRQTARQHREVAHCAR